MENEGVDQPHSSTKMSIGKAGEEPQALEPKVVEQDTRILYIRSAVERFVNCMFICMDQLVIEAVFQSQALNVQRLRVIWTIWVICLVLSCMTCILWKQEVQWSVP